MCRHVTTFGWTVIRGRVLQGADAFALNLFYEQVYLPWNLSSRLPYFSCRVICFCRGNKLRERRKGIKVIFDGGDSIIWRILPKIYGHGVKPGIIPSAPRKTERVMVEVGEYIT